MATPKVPREVAQATSLIGEHGELGRPLFTKLVPYSVHVAASIYAERRDRLVNHSIIEELNGLNLKLHELVHELAELWRLADHVLSLLRSLSLPGSLQALDKPLGLPPGLVAHAEEVRQQGGVNRLHRSMEDVARLKENDRAMYVEGVQLLQLDAAEDDRARLKYGTERWTRLPSREAAPELYSQANEIDGYMKSAQSSDELVENKLRATEQLLRILAGPNSGLEEFIPSTRRPIVTPSVERAAAKLRALLSDVSRIEHKRRRAIEAIKHRAEADDIS